MPNITPEDVAKLAAAATPGPWRAYADETAAQVKGFPYIKADDYEVVGLEGMYGGYETDWANAAFIVAAHDMADLIARMDEALKAAEALSEKAHRIANFTIGGMLADDAETRARYPALATAIIETRDALAAYRTAREKLK